MKAFLGIDVSKGYAEFVLLNEAGKRLENTLQFDDTSTGHRSLKEWITEAMETHGITQLDCAVESTGGFENNWFAALIKWSYTMALRVARLNPSVVKNASKAELAVNTTDSESARNIASYIRRFEDKVDYSKPDTKYSSFRTLQNHLQMIINQRTQIICELKQLLYISFPELQQYCKSSIPNWVLTLLNQYPSITKLSKAKPEKLSKIKGITLLKANTIIEKAKQSIASRNTAFDEFVLKQMIESIIQKQDHIDQIKKYLGQNCTGKETELIETIKGIGKFSAASIMIQIEDVNRFASPKELASYFGLHPTIKESGDKKALSRMSKRGRPALRCTLYMCAKTAVTYDPYMASIYARHRAAGKNHKQAIGVIMHKMLRIIWGILKSGKAYDPQIDQCNQEKKQIKTEEKAINELVSKRRLQKFDEDAPISRLAYRKRKVHILSQAGIAEQVRDLDMNQV
jgi:transposase